MKSRNDPWSKDARWCGQAGLRVASDFGGGFACRHAPLGCMCGALGLGGGLRWQRETGRSV